MAKNGPILAANTKEGRSSSKNKKKQDLFLYFCLLFWFLTEIPLVVANDLPIASTMLADGANFHSVPVGLIFRNSKSLRSVRLEGPSVRHAGIAGLFK